MGYLGTLDPLATGILVLFVGSATRLIPLFEGAPKGYHATIKLGEQTDTLDAQGKIISQKPLGNLTTQQVSQAILAWQGQHAQQTPAFSAIKDRGVPAYQLARSGKEAHRRTRQVCFHTLEIVAITLPYIQINVLCSAGTYIRVLASDIGESLKVGAHLTALRRTSVGSAQTPPQWTLKQSTTLADLIKTSPSPYILDVAPFLPHHVAVEVKPQALLHLEQGRPTAFTLTAAAQNANLSNAWLTKTPLKALNKQGHLLATGNAVQTDLGWQIQPSCVMRHL